MPQLPTPFLDAVQHNCDVSDAQHAGSYTLCIYLMHMREYFRWERQLSFDVVLRAEEVGEWVQNRESYWDTLGDASYRPLPLPGQWVDAYEGSLSGNNISRLKQVVRQGATHWLDSAAQILNAYHKRASCGTTFSIEMADRLKF